MAKKKKAQEAVEETTGTTATPEVNDEARKAAKKEYEAAKAESSAKWKEVQAFMKKHKLKPGLKPDEIEDKKVQKAYKELRKEHKNLKGITEEKEAEMKKYKSSRAGNFARKYEYPEGLSNAEKKKLRTQWRAEAKKAAKAEAGEEETPKKAKKSKAKAETAEVAAKPAKAKKSKKAAKVADEDED